MTSLDAALHREATDVLLRYAVGVDRRDWPLLRSCFTEDCAADYGFAGSWQGADALIAFMAKAHEGCGRSLHRITNPFFTPSPGGIGALSYVDAIVMGLDERNGIHTAGTYEDELVRTSDGWRIARRRFTPVFLRAVSSDLHPA